MVRGYDHLAGTVDRFAFRFDEMLQRHDDPARFGAAYGVDAARPMRLMRLLTANVRVYAIFLACLAGDPRLFWWFEIVPLTAVLLIGLVWHRAVEIRLTRSPSTQDHTSQRT